MFQTDIYHAIESGQIKVWLIATNPMSSLPNTARVRRAMEKLEFCAVQDCYEDTESAQYAHRLPARRHFGRRKRGDDQYRAAHQPGQTDHHASEARPGRICGYSTAWPSASIAREGQVSRACPDIFPGDGVHFQRPAGRHSGMNHTLIEQSRGIQWPHTLDQVERGEAPPSGASDFTKECHLQLSGRQGETDSAAIH